MRKILIVLRDPGRGGGQRQERRAVAGEVPQTPKHREDRAGRIAIRVLWDEILDPTDLTLITTVNGEVMQEARTDDLVHSIAALLAYFARWFPFRPGDVLTTGSPPGTGIERNPPAYLKEGDIVSVRVDGIGTLSNSVVKAPPN